MLYSLIPPILIVLSLIGIILMLVKKSKQVASLPDEHFRAYDEAAHGQPSFFGRIMWTVKNARWDDLKHFSLAILEKIVRKSRVVFLKLETRFANLSNDIRSRRQARLRPKMHGQEQIRQENDILRKLETYQPVKNEEVDVEMETELEIEESRSRRRIFARKAEVSATTRKAARKIVADEEQEVRPMISEQVAAPRARKEIKDRLEELLIERIAVNPKDIEAYERLGEYYMEIKSYMDAKECFKQVIKLNPADRNAKYRMRRLENILAKQ